MTEPVKVLNEAALRGDSSVHELEPAMGREVFQFRGPRVGDELDSNDVVA